MLIERDGGQFRDQKNVRIRERKLTRIFSRSATVFTSSNDIVQRREAVGESEKEKRAEEGKKVGRESL